MKYSLDKMHEPKPYKRRVGKTVDAVVDAIGKVMVGNHEVIPFIVPSMDRVMHTKQIFIDVLINHFKETPHIIKQNEWGIVNWNSRIIVFTDEQWGNRRLGLSTDIEPTYDL